ncbi:sensor histidine kinase [Virgibacillus oceani]|uniref:histidine kinase n=1 Tax=Virgibacillus oceani TaxID=1479511 RepID=A0A917GYC7_9BACI|nr:ATP-binding protein [Virgibacillus oceani]GGG61123.1 two-component sensor histidine kinase [Virgibacillus oceani]
MFNKLSLKIGLLFFVFILVIESFLFFILYTNLAHNRIDEVMDSILARGNTHRDVLEDNYNQSTLEHVGIMESTSEYVVVITDKSGSVIVASDPLEQEMLNVMKHTEGNIIPTEGKVVEDRWKQKEYIATESPITINGEHKGHVYMFANTSNVKSIVDQLNNQFIVVGLITIFLTIVTVFILSRFITIPLIKMKKATEQLSSGATKVDLHTGRKDELGELASTISKLSNDLERVKTERNEFLANVAHELRTPLTYIKGYADIVSRQGISKEDKKEYLAIIREETEQLTVLIKNLFELAKMDENKFIIKPEEVTLYKLIQSVENRISPLYEEKNITLSVVCPQNIIVFIDPERFQQVLVNILDNARKYTSVGGQVLLKVSRKDDDISIIISDNGEGIPKEDLPYIFDRLYRVEKSRSRQGGGTGLGLAIAKEIVESHEGTIVINSEQSKGTSVIIRLREVTTDE